MHKTVLVVTFLIFGSTANALLFHQLTAPLIFAVAYLQNLNLRNCAPTSVQIIPPRNSVPSPPTPTLLICDVADGGTGNQEVDFRNVLAQVADCFAGIMPSPVTPSPSDLAWTPVPFVPANVPLSGALARQGSQLQWLRETL